MSGTCPIRASCKWKSSHFAAYSPFLRWIWTRASQLSLQLVFAYAMWPLHVAPYMRTACATVHYFT
eukprot:6214031-Pleurochrysis_carterae.AAC.1